VIIGKIEKGDSMLKMSMLVDDAKDKVQASLELGQASLADMAIAERMLRRYLRQVVGACDELLDKDTDSGKKAKVQQTEEEGI